MESSYKQGAAFAVGAATAGKVFSFCMGLLIAWFFGAGSGTDIYFYILLTAAVLNGWLTRINADVIVPEFMHLRQSDMRGAMDFANFFIYVYLFLAVMIVFVCFFAPAKMLGLISAFPREIIAKHLIMAGLGALYFSSFFVMSFLVSLAESYKIFRIYFLAPLNALLPLILLILTRRIEAVLAGYICAYLIQIAAALIMLRFGAGWQFTPAKPQFSKKFTNNFLFHQPNNIAWAALLYAPLFMVSSAAAGMVSAVNYSRMLTDGPLDIFVDKLNNVAKVKMTTHAAARDFTAAAQTLLRTDRVILFAMIPFCVFSAVYSLDIVKLFFQRGGFTLQDARNTAAFLQIFILALPLIAAHNNLINYFAALRIIKEITPRYFVLAIIFTAVFIIAIAKLGAFAYPAVFLALYLALMFMNIFTAAQFAPSANYGRHMLRALKLLLLSIAACAAVYICCGNYFESSFLNLLLNGSLFVALNTALLFVAGCIKQFKQDLG